MIEMSVEVVASARMPFIITDDCGNKHFVSITKDQLDMLEWLYDRGMIYYEVQWESLNEIELERI